MKKIDAILLKWNQELAWIDLPKCEHQGRCPLADWLGYDVAFISPTGSVVRALEKDTVAA